MENLLHLEEIACVGESEATAVFQVRAQEPYFADHFPDFAIVPGVVLLGLMERLAWECLRRGSMPEHVYTSQVRHFKVNAVIRPGDRLGLMATGRERDDGTWAAQARVRLPDNDQVASARFVFACSDAGEP